MSKNFIKLLLAVEKLRKLTNLDFRLYKFSDGYGLVLDIFRVASTIKGILQFCEEYQKRYKVVV